MSLYIIRSSSHNSYYVTRISDEYQNDSNQFHDQVHWLIITIILFQHRSVNSCTIGQVFVDMVST